MNNMFFGDEFWYQTMDVLWKCIYWMFCHYEERLVIDESLELCLCLENMNDEFDYERNEVHNGLVFVIW